MPTRLPVCGAVRQGAVSPRPVSEKSGGFPSVPSSFRVVPACQGRSFVASLRDGLRPPLTGRPAPESRKTAGKPPKKRHGPRARDGSLRDQSRGRASARRASGPPDPWFRARGATTRTRG
ncbi:hypothetical protein D1J60_24440 [Streptomyces sp. W1SF4]|nr:hypothetical protein D1J60_24440 [Streptomyces sp. W1SF4]